MSVRLIVLSALSAVAVLPAAALAQERQPVARPKIQMDDQDPQVLRRMRAITQRRARLGVTVDLRASDSDSIGATLSAVTPGGPAAKAGLKSGDIVTRIDGKSLTSTDNTRSGADESLPGVRLVEYASQLRPNDTISVEYRRAGTRHTTSLVTGDEPLLTMEIFPDGGDFEMKAGGITLGRSPFRGMIRGEQLPGGGMSYSLGFSGGPLADLELAPLNPDLGQYFGTSEGVLVINVPGESALGVKGGDVILSVDGRKATGPSSLLRILRSYDEGDSFKLEIMRNKTRTSVTGKLEKR